MNMYEQGGITGPNPKDALIAALKGGAMPGAGPMPAGAGDTASQMGDITKAMAVPPPGGALASQVGDITKAMAVPAPTAAAPPQGGMAGPASPESPGGPMAAAPHFNTRLMEGDPGKLADVAHAAESPKYDFLQLAQKGTHDYNDLGGMLKDLQGGANGKLWNGWSANGDKLNFTGDPSQLAPEWNGVKSVDAIGGFHSGHPQGFRWGVDDPNAKPGLPQAGAKGGSSLNAILQGSGSDGVQQALSQLGTQPDMLKQLIASLGHI